MKWFVAINGGMTGASMVGKLMTQVSTSCKFSYNSDDHHLHWRPPFIVKIPKVISRSCSGRNQQRVSEKCQ